MRMQLTTLVKILQDSDPHRSAVLEHPMWSKLRVLVADLLAPHPELQAEFVRRLKEIEA